MLELLVLFVQVYPPAWGVNQSNFVVHGVWPEFINGSWPEYCSNVPFNETTLNPIQSELMRYWTNFRDPEHFWKHEWYKHGTCTCTGTCIKNATNCEWAYFTTGLVWYQKFSMQRVLGNGGLYPERKYYSSEHVLGVIKSILGVRARITCTSSNLLEQVELCMWGPELSTMKLKDCPLTVKNECPNGVVY